MAAPEPPGGPAGIDRRVPRLEHALVAVIVLGGFVFGVWYVVGLVAVALYVRAAAGSGLDWLAVSPARPAPPGSPLDDIRVVRFDALLGGVGLTLATLLFARHLNGLGWAVSLLVAGVSAVRAATGASIASALGRRARAD
jgi:hypothetical protein